MKTHHAPAFSLIEIMVAVTLLSVIIISLVAMFNQTQRAFTSSVNQVDVLAGGRMTGDVVARDVEQMAVTNSDMRYSNGVTYPNDNVSFWMENTNTNVWPLAVGGNRTNVLSWLTFHTSYQPGDTNRLGAVVSYRVYSDSNGVGTLMRYEARPRLLGTNTNAIVDGVVGFLTQPLDVTGTPVTNKFKPGTIPHAVLLEYAVLERRTFEQYEGLSNNSVAAANFVTNQAGHLHVFRQRISVKAIEPSTP